MANLDGGHYFLTALAPVEADPVLRADGSVTSPTASLREALASLPTAQQSEACVAIGHHSPFARCDRTHFARLVVIDQPAFNGRDPGNSLVQAIQKTDLLAHQPVDALTRAWLLLAVDFDADDSADHGLHDYLKGLWAVMSPELRDVFRHCHGFDPDKTDAEGFAAYIQRCQVETTMPFNDYWTVPLDLPVLSFKTIGAIAAGILVGVMLLAWALTGLLGVGGGWAWLALPVAIGAALFGAYRLIGGRGARPFPAAPDSDLRSILKALYLQQHFARFAAAQQGASPDALHAAFAAFVGEHRPAERAAPRQAPGVVRT